MAVLNGLKRLYKLLSPGFQKMILEYPLELTDRYSKPYHQGLYEITQKYRHHYEHWIDRILDHKTQLQAIKHAADLKPDEKLEPGWNNGYLPGLDIASLYTIIAELKPSKYVEIGSGNSTRVAARAIRESGAKTQITSIDPYPRVDMDQLANNIIRKTIDKVDMTLFDELNEGDVLYVDNSHVCFPNSDVTIFFLDILPRLKKGVIVHVHDIYIPYDYPDFMVQRFYSEQYMLATYLLNSVHFEIVLPNFFVYKDKELSGKIQPLFDHPTMRTVETHGGSFWFKIS